MKGAFKIRARPPLFTTDQVRIPKPPPGVIELLINLDIAYDAGCRDSRRRQDFRVALSHAWPEIRTLVWRAIGRAV